MPVVKLDQLVRRAQAGDPKARAKLGHWMIEKLSCFFRSGSYHQEAVEVAQNVLVVLWRDLDAFESQGPNSFEHYLVKVATIQVRSIQRKRYREQLRLTKIATSVQTPGGTLSSLMLVQQQRELLNLWLPQVREPFRRTLEHWLDGGADETLAESEGIAVSTVRSRRHRACNLLRALIEQARVTPSTPSPAA